jgi:hypothetical protein
MAHTGEKIAMRVWITCFILLFGGTELLQWVKQFSLPLPIFILGGVFLAIASNYDKLSHLPFHLDYEDPPDSCAEIPPTESAPLPVSPKKSVHRPISFEIHKPFQPRD